MLVVQVDMPVAAGVQLIVMPRGHEGGDAEPAGHLSISLATILCSELQQQLSAYIAVSPQVSMLIAWQAWIMTASRGAIGKSHHIAPTAGNAGVAYCEV